MMSWRLGSALMALVSSLAACGSDSGGGARADTSEGGFGSGAGGVVAGAGDGSGGISEAGSGTGGGSSAESGSSSGGSSAGGAGSVGGSSAEGGSGNGGSSAGGAGSVGGTSAVGGSGTGGATAEGGAPAEAGAEEAGGGGEAGAGLGGTPSFSCPIVVAGVGSGSEAPLGSGAILVADVFPSAANTTAPRVVVNRNNEAVVYSPRDDAADTEPDPPVLRWYSPTEGRLRERDFPHGALADAMAIDGEASLWLGITNTRQVSFGAETLVGAMPGYFVQKLSESGEPLLGFSTSTEESVLISDVVADGEGGVFVVAHDSIVDSATSSANDRLVLDHRAADGSSIFRQIIGSVTGAVMPEDAELLPDGRLVVVGGFDGSVDFAGTTLETLAWDGETPYFNGWIAVFEPDDGRIASLVQVESTGTSGVNSVAVRADGQLAIAGGFRGSVAFDTFSDDFDQTVAFVATLDPSGRLGMLTTLDERSVGNAVDWSSEGSIFAAGTVVTDAGTTEELARAFLLQTNSDGLVTTLFRSSIEGMIPYVVAADHCGGAWFGGYLSNTPEDIGLPVAWPGGWGEFPSSGVSGTVVLRGGPRSPLVA